MSSAELEGVFEAIDDDENGVLDLSELRKMWTFLGMHMEARGTTREHVTSDEEDTVSAASTMVISAEVDTTGWCAFSGPAVKCEDGWWRSCDWPLAPGFEHSVWIDGQMVGTFHDPALVVTAPPNEEDAEEEDDEPTVMITQVGSKTVTTVVGKSRFAEDAGTVSADSWRRRKKKGPRKYSFDPVAGLLADQQCHSSASSGSGNAVRIHELHHTMPHGHLTVSIERCTGLKREKIHRIDGVFCVVVANNSGIARRSGTVYETGKTLSWKGHHGTIVFSGLDVPPPLLHIFVLRRTPVASVAAAVADSDGASRRSTTHKSTQAVRAALVEIYTTHNPAKLRSLDALLREWKGHEGELLANVTAKYTAQDSVDFDAWGRTGGCVLLGAASLQFDQAPPGRSWRLSQDVVLLSPLQGTRGSHSEATSADDDGASLEIESEAPGGISVSRMMLGARGGPGGWGSECVHAGKLRMKVRWEEPSRGYNTHRRSSAGPE